MQLLVFITVGYIIGIIWGLYLKINIVPFIFLSVGILWLISRKTSKLKKLKWHYVLFIFAIFISNLQINYLENKFDKLYLDLQKVNITGIISSEGKKEKYKTSYIIKVQSINGDTKYKNTYLNLYVTNNKKLEYGKKISFIRDI